MGAVEQFISAEMPTIQPMQNGIECKYGNAEQLRMINMLFLVKITPNMRENINRRTQIEEKKKREKGSAKNGQIERGFCPKRERSTWGK